MAIFRFFNMAAAAILDFRIFKGRNGQEGRTTSLYQISSKSLEPQPRYNDFSKMAAVRHLGFVKRVWWPPRNGIWWSLSLCKICWNRCSIFGNMHVFSISQVWLKTPIHAPKFRVFGPLNGEQCEKSQNGTSLRESTLIEPSCAKIHRRVWPVGEFPKRA